MRTNTGTMFRILLVLCGILALILDAPTASEAVREGIALCIETVIPSLFPFFLLSALLVGSLHGIRFHGGARLCTLWNLPEGCESILLIALTGGYPIGAKTVSSACAQGLIAKEDALRMIGFCNNAGPAFILGITPMLFSSPTIPWVLWILQIFSAWGAARLLGRPCKAEIGGGTMQSKAKNNPIMMQSLRSMVLVCGWIVIFRVVIDFARKWLLLKLPVHLRVFLCGLIELTNGCCMLREIPHEDLRFFLCAIFLCSGGICVTMQTISLLHHIDSAAYIRGKAVQSGICVLMTAAVLPFLFPDSAFPLLSSVMSAIFLFLAFVFAFKRNYSRKRNRNRV